MQVMLPTRSRTRTVLGSVNTTNYTGTVTGIFTLRNTFYQYNCMYIDMHRLDVYLPLFRIELKLIQFNLNIN